MSAQLKPSWDEESVQLRVQGLALLAPVSVSLDQPDLPAFVPNQIMLASMSDNFSAFDHSLQRLTLSELRPAIENAAQQIMSAPVTPPSTEFEAGLQQLEYEAFLAASGKKDPLRKHQEIAEFQQREEAAYTAQQQAAHDAFWEHRED
jgi:hypothetical protein